MSKLPLGLNRSYNYSFILLFFTLLFFIPLSAFSQDIIEIDGDDTTTISPESDGSFTVTAADLFYDAGGVNDPHGSQSFSIKLCSDDNTKTIGLKFNVIALGLGSKLTFKNGLDQDLAPTDISRDENGSVVVVSSNDGCITVNFDAASFSGNGWEAEVLLSTPCEDLDLNVSNVYPNKDAFGNIIANVNEPIQINQISGLSPGVQYDYAIDYGNGNSMGETGLSFPIAIPAYASSGIYQLKLTVKDTVNETNFNLDGTVNYCEYDLNIPVAVGVASSGVAEIDILEDSDNDGVVNLACGAVTTDIHADFVEVNGTTDYKVDEILYKPFETDGQGNILEPEGDGYENPFTIGKDDVWSTPKQFPTGFKFCFYGEEYQWFRMSSNGALALLKTNSNGDPINNKDQAPISLSVTEPDDTYDIYPALPSFSPGDSWDYFDDEDTLGGLNYSSTSNPDLNSDFFPEGDQLVNAIMLLQDLNPKAAKHSEFLTTDYQTDSSGAWLADSNGLILENDFGIPNGQDFITLNQGFYDSLTVGDEILFDFDNQSIGQYSPIPTSPLRTGNYFVVEKITGTTQIKISETPGGTPIVFQNNTGTNQYISRTQVFYTEAKMGKFGYKLVNEDSENNRALVMTIYDVPHYFINDLYAYEALDELYTDPDNPSNTTFQIVLYETTNVIELFVENRPKMSGEAAVVNKGQALIGIQGNVNDLNYQDTQFKLVNVDDQDSINSNTDHNDNGNANWEIKRRAWRFTPDSGTSNTDVKWFKIDASSGAKEPILGANSNTLSNQTEGDYIIEVTYRSCDATATGTPISKTFSVAPSANITTPIITPSDNAVCSGENADFNITAAANTDIIYTLDGGVNTKTITTDTNGEVSIPVSSLSKDTTLTITGVTEPSGCSNLSLNEISTIIVNTLLTPTFDVIDPVCIGDPSPLSNVSMEGVTGFWTPDFNDKVTTVYTFIPDNNQCVDTSPVTIKVPLKPLEECIEYELFPKFFTPNGNGQNDTWVLYKLLDPKQSQSYAVVYDRYGKELITLTPSNAEWDGTYRGNPMPSNDYWVMLYYFSDELGKMVQHTGHFALKR